MITEGFMEIVRRINSGQELIAIGGPKGVGKSLALAAIATLCHNTRPYLLFSLDSLISPTFKRYLNEIHYQFSNSKLDAFGLDGGYPCPNLECPHHTN
jgi:ABC-type iron transport system FetAB ATPase subunit